MEIISKNSDKQAENISYGLPAARIIGVTLYISLIQEN